jgi:hypothetical protein
VVAPPARIGRFGGVRRSRSSNVQAGRASS